MAAGAPQAVPDARQPERRDRAQGAAHHGHPGLRQEPLGQGHRLLLPAAALPHRHDRDLLRAARQARRRVRRGLPDDGRHGAGGALVRRDRDGDHIDGIRRRAGPHLRVLPHLDAGEDARAVRGRHRQPHRPAARRDDPQGTFRRGVLRRPAAGRRAIEIFKIHLSAPGRRSRPASTSNN